VAAVSLAVVLLQLFLLSPAAVLAADTTIPQIGGLSLRTPGPFFTNQAVTIDFTATDSESDVSLVTFIYEGPGTVERQTSVSNPNPTSAVLQTGDQWSTGTYFIKRIIVMDAAYNVSDYRPDGTIFKYPGSATGPDTHTLDLSVLSFYLDNPAFDTTIPTLAAITRREAGPFVPGEVVHFDINAVDASTVTKVIAQFRFPAGGSYQVGTSQFYDATIELHTGGSWPVGSYTLERVTVVDGAGNKADYLPDGTIAKYRLDAIGPDTHTLDLDQLSFVVDYPTLSVNDISVDEDDGEATFQVLLSRTLSVPVWVYYATAYGTAAAPGDYAFVGGQMKFEPGEVTKAISVPIVNDTLQEPNETLFMNLSSPANAVLGDGQAIGSIFDNDPIPSLTVDDVRVNEGAGVAMFTVHLSNPSDSTVTVDFGTAPGSARSDRDYVEVGGTLTFDPGQMIQTIAVPIVNDRRDEAREKFFVNLSRATNASIADSRATGKIIDND
jgi:hypothetical protein